MNSLIATATLPEHSNDGYVAAAYIVFLAIVLIYVTIMAIRLSRVERKVEELRHQDHGTPMRARESPPGEQPSTQAVEGSGQEREKV
jgi:hypothetical protein